MNLETFTFILLVGAIVAGFVGSLTGLGGGIIIIPLLTLVFHIDIRYVVGVALITSIATSTGAAAAYIREGITNVRIGMFLEIATTTGAVIGALIATSIDKKYIAIIFAMILVFTAYRMIGKKKSSTAPQHRSNKWGTKLHLNGSYPTKEGVVHYKVYNVLGGYSLMTLAGILSGLLGIGGGAMKVLAMDGAMKIPFKVSTTTSNFMIGVTGATGAVIYFQRGYIDPGLALPIMVGVLIGAYIGSKILPNIAVGKLRKFFAYIIVLVALLMLYNGITGGF